MNDAELLERILDGDPLPGADVPASIDRLAMLADVLSHAAAPVPARMEGSARDALRNSLIREANLREASPPPFMTRLRDRVVARGERMAYSGRTALSGGVAAAVLSMGGVGAATMGALPGDAFYNLKLSAEDLVLSWGDAGVPQGEGLLRQATNRIAEAEASLRRGQPETAALALRLADDHARSGAREYLAAYLDDGDTAVLAELGSWVVTTNRRLDLLPPLEGDSAVALEEIRTTLNRIGQRIEVLTTGACSSCALGVHDDPNAPPTAARGVEADGTPPTPVASPVDLTFIPKADRPFQACPCVAPAPAGSAVPVEPAAPVEPAPAPADPGTAPQPTGQAPPPGNGGGGGSGGGGGGGGGGPLPVPLPDAGPVADQLPDPVRNAVEEIIEQIPADPAVERPGAAPAVSPEGPPAAP